MLIKESPNLSEGEIKFISQHFKLKDSIPQNLIDINRFLKASRLFVTNTYLEPLKISYSIFEPNAKGYIDPKEVEYVYNSRVKWNVIKRDSYLERWLERILRKKQINFTEWIHFHLFRCCEFDFEGYKKYIKNTWGDPNKSILHGYHYVNQLKDEANRVIITKTWNYNPKIKKFVCDQTGETSDINPIQADEQLKRIEKHKEKHIRELETELGIKKSIKKRMLNDEPIVYNRAICLIRCNLSKLPPVINITEGIEYINLSHNKLVDVPVLINNYDKLKILNLSYNDIKSITLYSLSNLTTINLSNNQISSFPNSIIMYFVICIYLIEKIDQFPELPSLKSLNLSHNRLKNLPSVFSTLYSLETLNLSVLLILV